MHSVFDLDTLELAINWYMVTNGHNLCSHEQKTGTAENIIILLDDGECLG